MKSPLQSNPLFILTVIFSLCSLNPIVGQVEVETPDSLEFSVYTLEEFVVRDERIRSLNNYAQLDSEILSLQDQRHIFQSLNTVPGVFMQSGAMNTNRITIRGIGNRSPFSTNKIKAYLDDIPLTDGIGETTVEDVDLSIIRNVDVWKGPTASRYGAGLGGMLHFQTDDKNKTDSYFGSTFSYGSYNTKRFVEEALYNNQAKEFSAYLNYNNLSSDGYRDNNEYDRHSFSLLTRSKIKGGDFTIFYNYLDLKAFIPSSLNEDDFINSPTKAAFTWGQSMGFEDYKKNLIGLSYNRTAANNWKYVLSANYYGFDSFELRPFNTLAVKSNAFSGRIIMSKDSVLLEKLSFEIGSEFYFQKYNWDVFETIGTEQGELINANEEERNYQNIFSELKYRVSEKLVAKMSLNYNNTKYKIVENTLNGIPEEPEYSDQIISPRFIVSYHPGLSTQFYFNMSHGFSPPTLEETLDPNGSINRDIRPETGWNYEVGGRGELLDARLNYEWTLYRMEITDLLVARRTDFDQFVGVNAGHTRHQGFEMDMSYTFLETCCKKYELRLIYSYSDFDFVDFIDGDDDFSGNELTGTAPHMLNGIFSVQQKSFYGNLHYQFVDAIPLRDDNSIYSDNYQLINAKIGYKKQFGLHWELDVYAGISNILDEKYASMYQINASSFGGAAPRYFYPGLPRNYFTGINLRYVF